MHFISAGSIVNLSKDNEDWFVTFLFLDEHRRKVIGHSDEFYIGQIEEVDDANSWILEHIHIGGNKVVVL